MPLPYFEEDDYAHWECNSMIFKDYEIQFNVHPASELETYCKLEDVSMLFMRKPNKCKTKMKKWEKARVIIGSKIIRLGLHIAGVRKERVAN